MTTNASRAPIDLDALARELHQSSSPQSESPAPAAAKGDPLAELARIVGQDDPFRALLAARGVSFRGDAARVEPTFEAVPVPDEAPPHQPTPADAFDQYLASVEQSHQADHQDGSFQDPAAFESDDREYANAATGRPRGRSRLIQVGAGLGVLVFCVTGAFAYKGLFGGSHGGEPVTVLADRTPLKVAPEKADGVEIPDQNKQIYERNGKDGQIKVVNREEQPLDVAQAARAASGRDAGGQNATTPGGGLLTESLGEPRKIRTVAVKPDAPPPAMQAAREAQAAAASTEAQPAPVSPIPTMTMPGSPSESTPKRATRALASTKPAPAATPAAEPSEVAEAAPNPAPATPAPRKAVQRVASVAPETTATIEPEAPVASAPAAVSSSGGGFAVQLGVRNSEADAKAAFRQMQGKYSQLAGKPELIRQAEVNGKSLYRVRVGPLGKSEATSLCTALKGAGGQCFVAAN